MESELFDVNNGKPHVYDVEIISEPATDKVSVAFNLSDIENSLSCINKQCCWMGICLKSNKVTYIIDNSFFMNEDYLHQNGRLVNGNWQPINEPELISPRINGKNLFEYTLVPLSNI